MTEQKPNPDLLSRIIVLMYGILESGGPCWIFSAVKPSKYQAFLTAYKESKLDVYNFEGFGEIIVSGEGKSPPDQITLKVAEMYQTSPSELLQPIEISKNKKKSTEDKT